MTKAFKIWAKIALVMIIIGLIFIGIGLGTGGSMKSLSIGPHTFNEMGHNYNIPNLGHKKEEVMNDFTSDDIHSMDIKIDAGEVQILEGDDFKLVSNYKDNYIESYEEDGTWKIKTKNSLRSKWFGFTIGHNINKVGSIDIYIPKDFHGKSISLEVGAGKMTIHKLKADEIDLEVGAGKMTIDSLDANKKADIEVGVGHIGIDQAKLNGKSIIECGIGNIEIGLVGEEKDYNFNVDAGIGSVKINDAKYSMTSSTRSLGDHSGNEIYIECGIGNVVIQNEK